MAPPSLFCAGTARHFCHGVLTGLFRGKNIQARDVKGKSGALG
jgi:hypothetical protein